MVIQPSVGVSSQWILFLMSDNLPLSVESDCHHVKRNVIHLSTGVHFNLYRC